MNRDDLLGAHAGYGYGARLRFDQIVDVEALNKPKAEAARPVEADVSWRDRAVEELGREILAERKALEPTPSIDWVKAWEHASEAFRKMREENAAAMEKYRAQRAKLAPIYNSQLPCASVSDGAGDGYVEAGREVGCWQPLSTPPRTYFFRQTANGHWVKFERPQVERPSLHEALFGGAEGADIDE